MQSSKPEINVTQSIINQLGMGAEREVDADSEQRNYERSMKRRYGKKGLQFMKHMDRRSAVSEELHGSHIRKGYRLKNSDWRMSLQVSRHSEAEKHAAFINWLSEADFPPPMKVCEIGCDIGIQACAMKLLWRESYVTGFDQVKEAVTAAEYHAKSLDLRAIDFEQLDLHSKLPEQYLGAFDLAICPWTLHEVIPSTDISTEEMQEEWRRNPALEPMQVVTRVTSSVTLDEREEQALRNLSALVKSGGRIVSVDRMLYGVLQQQPIIRELKRHGFEHVKSDEIIVHSANGQERFPIFVLEKAE